MTPALLTEYLDALRGARCMSAEVVLPGGAAIRAVFAPELDAPVLGTPIAEEPQPGAWKWKGEGQS